MPTTIIEKPRKLVRPLLFRGESGEMGPMLEVRTGSCRTSSSSASSGDTIKPDAARNPNLREMFRVLIRDTLFAALLNRLSLLLVSNGNSFLESRYSKSHLDDTSCERSVEELRARRNEAVLVGGWIRRSEESLTAAVVRLHAPAYNLDVLGRSMSERFDALAGMDGGSVNGNVVAPGGMWLLSWKMYWSDGDPGGRIGGILLRRGLDWRFWMR